MATQWLTVPEFAKLMGMHEQTVRDMCRKGDIPARKLGSVWKIPYTEPADVRAEEELKKIVHASVERSIEFIDNEVAMLSAMRESLARNLGDMDGQRSALTP